MKIWCLPLLPDSIINIDKLPPDHPLLQPIESIELKMAINFSKPNKAPGSEFNHCFVVKACARKYNEGL